MNEQLIQNVIFKIEEHNQKLDLQNAIGLINLGLLDVKILETLPEYQKLKNMELGLKGTDNYNPADQSLPSNPLR